MLCSPCLEDVDEILLLTNFFSLYTIFSLGFSLFFSKHSKHFSQFHLFFHGFITFLHEFVAFSSEILQEVIIFSCYSFILQIHGALPKELSRICLAFSWFWLFFTESRFFLPQFLHEFFPFLFFPHNFIMNEPFFFFFFPNFIISFFHASFFPI